MSTLVLNKHYNFSLYTNPVLGVAYKNIKLVSILDFNTALKFDNVELLHRQISPYLPPGSNLNHLDYSYYLFKDETRDIVIADAWIIKTSIVETSGLNYTIRLNNITQSQYDIVRDQLRLLGISFQLL